MNRLSPRGFSLIELSFVVLLIGIVFAMSVPAYNGFRATNDLKGSAQNIAGQMRLAREKAIATGKTQLFHVNPGYLSTDYHVHPGGGGAIIGWRLPRCITFDLAATQSTYNWQRDGRCANSGLLVVMNAKGFRDTVSVQLSGIVLVQ